MKKKNQKIVLFIGILITLSLASFFFAFSCELFKIEDMQQDVKELSGNERDELEKNGRFLKIINLPLNTQVSNVISVSVSNSSSTVGKLNKNSPVMIYKDTDTCTAYLPLVSNDGKEFLNSGQFYTAFSVFIDALNKYIVDLSDQFIVQYTDGRGQADVNNLPSSVLAQNQQPSTSKEITENERDELEKNGHFLKLFNMPLHIQTPNVFSVSVSNSSSPVGTLDKNSPILIYREKATNTCTVYLPLVNTNGSGYLESDFLETGFFFTSFVIHVDALTKYIVDTSDQFIVQYTDGRGQTDVNNLPSRTVITPDPHYLTVFNLPQTVSIYNFSKVLVLNQTGAVAKCVDYSQIVLSVDEGKAAAKIPLQYASLSQDFTETGVFYVTLDINVDVETRYTLTLDDQVKVTFIDGNGFLNILNIPDKPVPYLSIKGLPLNATKKHVSNVNIYNLAGTVAGVADNKNIVTIKENNYLTFLIPLSSSASDNGYFQDTGRFAIEFTIDVDYETQISYSYNDLIILFFNNGSSVFDVNTTFGFFDASLTNINDSTAPIIKAKSSFDVFGLMCTLKNNYTVNSSTVVMPASSGVIYLYAFKYIDSDVFFEYSTTAPTYITKRKGWYNGNKRALWKMLYLKNSAQFLFKTYIENDFPQMGKTTLNEADYSQVITSKPLVKSINGAGNPAPETITLDPGVYVIELKGAGGGGGRMNLRNNPNLIGHRSSGGIVREIITLNSKTSFTAFTGSGGGDAPSADTSGSFNFVATKNYYEYNQDIGPLGIPVNNYTRQLIYSDSVFHTVVDFVQPNIDYTVPAGGGGGGGGSGSFLYSSSVNYLLVAGGGGGGGGGSCFTPGGGGGAGGTIGPGAGGGGSGTFSLYTDIPNVGGDFSTGNGGGTGGGLNGGNAAGKGANGGNADSAIPSLVSDYTISGGSSSASLDFSSVNDELSSRIQYLKYSNYGITSTTHNNTPGGIVDSHTYGWTSSGISTTPIVSLHTRVSGYTNSGRGGSAASCYFENSHSASSEGGAPGSTNKNDFTISGEVTSIDNVSSSAIASGPGTVASNWNALGVIKTRISFTIEHCDVGYRSTDGGNNRNSTRGGGADGGMPGSVKIHKIY